MMMAAAVSLIVLSLVALSLFQRKNTAARFESELARIDEQWGRWAYACFMVLAISIGMVSVLLAKLVCIEFEMEGGRPVVAFAFFSVFIFAAWSFVERLGHSKQRITAPH